MRVVSAGRVSFAAILLLFGTLCSASAADRRSAPRPGPQPDGAIERPERPLQPPLRRLIRRLVIWVLDELDLPKP
jgi:hypothetical protein